MALAALPSMQTWPEGPDAGRPAVQDVEFDGALGGDRQDASDGGFGVFGADDEVHPGDERDSRSACQKSAVVLLNRATASTATR